MRSSTFDSVCESMMWPSRCTVSEGMGDLSKSAHPAHRGPVDPLDPTDRWTRCGQLPSVPCRSFAPRKVHPVIVVGSGASGGMAAWNLTRQGIDVLLLDAGDKFDRSTFWTHVQPWEARERRARGEQPPQFFLDTKEQPYLTPEGKPFELIRVWGHGGKTNVWGRVSLRYSDLDFKGPAKDGWEIPWPIAYKDVAPYYDKVEQLIGVCGGDRRLGGAARQQVPACRRPRRAAASACCGARTRRWGSRWCTAGGRTARGRSTASPPATTAATADRAATPRRSSARPTTCCRSRSRPAASRSARTPSSAACSSATTASRPACSTSTGRPAPSTRCRARSW